jgi:hypothetical protein
VQRPRASTRVESPQQGLRPRMWSACFKTASGSQQLPRRSRERVPHIGRCGTKAAAMSGTQRGPITIVWRDGCLRTFRRSSWSSSTRPRPPPSQPRARSRGAAGRVDRLLRERTDHEAAFRQYQTVHGKLVGPRLKALSLVAAFLVPRTRIGILVRKGFLAIAGPTYATALRISQRIGRTSRARS